MMQSSKVRISKVMNPKAIKFLDVTFLGVKAAQWIGASIAVFTLNLWALPLRAQTEDQVTALVEALRRNAPDTGNPNDGLYSAWKVKADTLASWSKFCKQPTTPEEFAANEALAQSIIHCVVADLLKEEYAKSGGNIQQAVLQSASWWMAGDSVQYTQDSTINDYAQRVLAAYTAVTQQ
jgi:hypothetical protein